jgi:hypothetical protein
MDLDGFSSNPQHSCLLAEQIRRPLFAFGASLRFSHIHTSVSQKDSNKSVKFNHCEVMRSMCKRVCTYLYFGMCVLLFFLAI